MTFPLDVHVHVNLRCVLDQPGFEMKTNIYTYVFTDEGSAAEAGPSAQTQTSDGNAALVPDPSSQGDTIASYSTSNSQCNEEELNQSTQPQVTPQADAQSQEAAGEQSENASAQASTSKPESDIYLWCTCKKPAKRYK